MRCLPILLLIGAFVVVDSSTYKKCKQPNEAYCYDDDAHRCEPESYVDRCEVKECPESEPNGKCKCKKGYYRHAVNGCVKSIPHPPPPPPHPRCNNPYEAYCYDDDSHKCEPERYDDKCEVEECPESEPNGKCKCKKGYYRHAESGCVKSIPHLPPPPPPTRCNNPYEAYCYDDDSHRCEPESYDDKCEVEECPESEPNGKCKCKKGYYRHPVNGCVKSIPHPPPPPPHPSCKSDYECSKNYKCDKKKYVCVPKDGRKKREAVQSAA